MDVDRILTSEGRERGTSGKYRVVMVCALSLGIERTLLVMVHYSKPCVDSWLGRLWHGCCVSEGVVPTESGCLYTDHGLS